jgi:Rieske Fe-S protein
MGAVSLVVLGCAARLPPVRDVQAQGDELILALADYPELQQGGGVLPVRANGSGKPIMIVNQEGRFSAFSLKCTHLGCSVGWNEAARSFDCPCHGSRFAIDGTVMKGPAKRPLTAFAVQADGTTVRVRIA